MSVTETYERTRQEVSKYFGVNGYIQKEGGYVQKLKKALETTKSVEERIEQTILIYLEIYFELAFRKYDFNGVVKHPAKPTTEEMNKDEILFFLLLNIIPESRKTLESMPQKYHYNVIKKLIDRLTTKTDQKTNQEYVYINEKVIFFVDFDWNELVINQFLVPSIKENFEEFTEKEINNLKIR